MRIAFAFVAALLATPAFAADEPVATASPTPAPVTTAEQIDAYLKTSPDLDAKPPGEVDGVVARDDHKVHGVVSVGVGTGGYRSVYVETDMPVGENGRVRLAFEDTKGARGYPYRLHGPGPLGMVDRQRCDLEGMSAPRPLDVAGGPHGRCVGRIPGW
jgi:hypothetical protein